MKNLRWSRYDTVILFAAIGVILFGALNYGKLPDEVASHFGTNGKADGYMAKSGLLVLTVCLSLLPLALGVFRALDPKSRNYEKFGATYGLIRVAIALVLDAVSVMVICYNLGYEFNMGVVVQLCVGALFVVIGNYMPRLKDNWFIGIRNPWTMSDPSVWRKTHRMGGPLWVAAGLIVMAGAFLPAAWSVGMLIGAVVLCGVVPMLYSYLLWKRGSSR